MESQNTKGPGHSRSLEVPPVRVLLFILATFLGFVLLELWLYWQSKDKPLQLGLWDLIFWSLLIFWSVRVEVRLPLNAGMSQLFLFALALVVLTPPWVAPLAAFLAQWGGSAWYKEFFNRSQDGLATAIAALVWILAQLKTCTYSPRA